MRWSSRIKNPVTILLLLGIAALTGCRTTAVKATAARTAESRDEIRNLVQASRILECRLVDAQWTIPGDVGQAQLIKEDGQWALIYEALLRSGPRTVYQPIATNFNFNGDGIAMGLRGSPRVSDLRTFEDAARNRWYVSRIKASGSELFSGLVEVLVNGKRYISMLPLPRGESVQQIWPVSPSVSGHANIIVRTTTSQDPESAPSDAASDESFFRWFQVQKADNSARLVATYKSKGDDIQPAGFVAMENSKTEEPVAVTIIQPESSPADAEPKIKDGVSKVALRRIFGRVIGERVIFAGKGNISGLSFSDPTFHKSMHLAWIYKPHRGGSRYLQTVVLPVRSIPERYFQKGTIKEIETPAATELSYEANEPEFSFTVNNQNQPIPVLSWWGKLEDDVALLVQVITPAFPQSRGQTIRTSDGTQIGISFQPSMAIIPPRQFNRIMFFTAAPTQAEKSVMILSDRTDSADIAKESNLYSCLF